MLRVIGLNHCSAPLEVREQLAFTPTQVADALTVWQDQTTDLAAVLLSTCNRTEFYVATPENTLPTTEQLLRFLLNQKSSPQSIDRRVGQQGKEYAELTDLMSKT